MSGKIPEVTPPTVDVLAFKAEKSQFDDLDSFDRVDIRLRDSAGTAALTFVVLCWIAAFYLAFVVGQHFGDKEIPGDRRWTAVIALTAALFTAPTAIILAMLSSTRKRRGEKPDDSSDQRLPLAQIAETFGKPDA